MKMDIKSSGMVLMKKKPSHISWKWLKTFEFWVLRPESLSLYFELEIFFYDSLRLVFAPQTQALWWLLLLSLVSSVSWCFLVLCVSVAKWWEWFDIFNGQPSYWNKSSLPHWKPFSLLLFVYYFRFENLKFQTWTMNIFEFCEWNYVERWR